MRLVKEGKLSPEDATELLDAMQSPTYQEEPVTAGGGAPPPPPPPPPPPAPPSFSGFFEAIEKIGKDVTKGINWSEVGEQLRKGVHQGAEAVKKAASDLKEGKFSFYEAEIGEFMQPLVVPDGKILRVETISGDIKIICDPTEAGSVAATATFRGDDRETLKQKLSEFSLVIEESDHFVLIRQPDQAGLSVDFVVKLPNSVPVEVRSTSGDTSVTGAKGANKVKATSGDVTLSRLEGSLEVEGVSGNIAIDESKLSLLNVENKSGHVSLKHVHAATTVRTASGDVKLEKCGGPSLSIDGVSGDIQVQVDDPVLGSANLRTVNGLISMEVPGNSDFRLQASALRGEVICSLPLEEEVREDRRVTGRMGTGTGALDISTINGDIHVRLVDSQ
ncbi:MAG: DUF4097 family beta strand repeat protein [Chthonomonas sp.]|nr:DUF4097 family beta strand repeat protein [Chthonomonas sp.]